MPQGSTVAPGATSTGSPRRLRVARGGRHRNPLRSGTAGVPSRVCRVSDVEAVLVQAWPAVLRTARLLWPAGEPDMPMVRQLLTDTEVRRFLGGAVAHDRLDARAHSYLGRPGAWVVALDGQGGLAVVRRIIVWKAGRSCRTSCCRPSGAPGSATVRGPHAAFVPALPRRSRGLIGFRAREELLQRRGVQEVDPGHAVGQGAGVGGQ